MSVFVLNKHGETLMPCQPRKAKILLRTGCAKVISRSPFAIQLVYGSTGYKQELVLGVDTGHKEVGVSVTSKTKEVFSATVTMRNDISSKMDVRRSYRRNRRNKLRYRAPRFLNRSASTRKGRLAPSVQWKVDAHIRIIEQLKAFMPITKLVLETGTFDMQKMNNPEITNQQYQQGVQYGFENTKAYVLARDNYTCQHGGKNCSHKLHVHHIKFRSQGGSDAPSNLITLCEKHHTDLHAGKITLTATPRKDLRAATTMNIIRSRLLERFPQAIETFGYITKANRYAQGLEKSHANDAFTIAGGTDQKRCIERAISFKRKNNRSLQKNRLGFAPAIRRQRYPIQPNDIVEFEGRQLVSKGSQNKGKYIVLIDNGKRIVKSVKKIRLIYQSKGIAYS